MKMSKYIYIISDSGYEHYSPRYLQSDKKYTQEEFEYLVAKILERLLNEVMDKHDYIFNFNIYADIHAELIKNHGFEPVKFQAHKRFDEFDFHIGYDVERHREKVKERAKEHGLSQPTIDRLIQYLVKNNEDLWKEVREK